MLSLQQLFESGILWERYFNSVVGMIEQEKYPPPILSHACRDFNPFRDIQKRVNVLFFTNEFRQLVHQLLPNLGGHIISLSTPKCIDGDCGVISVIIVFEIC